jgi:hypothetical protein
MIFAAVILPVSDPAPLSGSSSLMTAPIRQKAAAAEHLTFAMHPDAQTASYHCVQDCRTIKGLAESFDHRESDNRYDE